MKTPQLGKDKILMFRLLKDNNKAAARLALQMEHTLKYARSTDTKQTKDGAVATNGGLTVTMDITAISTKDELNDMLKNSVIKGEKLEVWEIDLSTLSENKADALYMIGSLESWEIPAKVEDVTELSTSLKIDGVPVAGKATLTEEQQEQIAYVFKDITAGI